MIKKVYLSYSQCPESCWHIIQARAQGQPSILTYCRDKKTSNLIDVKARVNSSHALSMIVTSIPSHVPTKEALVQM